MLNKTLFAALVAVSSAACLDNSDLATRTANEPARTLAADDRDAVQIIVPRRDPRATDTNAGLNDGRYEPSVCDLLPTDADDPCSYLCDPAMLAQFIPHGACVTFLCELADGRQQLGGGCSSD